MNVVCIILWSLLLLVVVVVAVVLFCPALVKLVYDGENITLWIGYFFPFIKILPKKKKDEENISSSDNSEKTISEKKKSAENKAKKNKNNKKTGSDPQEKDGNEMVRFFKRLMKKRGLEGLLELLRDIAEIVMKTVKTVTSHLIISKMDINVVIVGEDPADTAMRFGYTCSAIYPLVALIEENIRKCHHRVQVTPGFAAEKTVVYLMLTAKLVPVFALIAAVSALVKAIKTYLKFKQ